MMSIPMKDFSSSQNNQRFPNTAFQIPGVSPFGNTAIFWGGGPSTHDGSEQNGTGELGNFLQSVITQITSGLTGGGHGHFPL